MEYETKVNLEDGEYELQISKFRSPVIEVFVDGAAKGTISMSPYKVSLGRLSGTHTLKIVAYGNRYNTFGALHLCNEQEIWHGPNAWRSRDEAYSYEYQLKPSGILAAPRLIRL
jgi:hypothetical protein